ncbi:MAG: response regulator [Candidatus Eisenbacteria bacterium]
MPKTILVIDDEQDAVDFVTEILEGAGRRVISENDGRAGLVAIRAERPDLVVLDVQMPKMNGFEVFEAMQKEDSLKSIPVIMLTGIRDKVGMGFSGEDMGKFYGHAPREYIEKPVNPAVFLEAVNKILGE